MRHLLLLLFAAIQTQAVTASHQYGQRVLAASTSVGNLSAGVSRGLSLPVPLGSVPNLPQPSFAKREASASIPEISVSAIAEYAAVLVDFQESDNVLLVDMAGTVYFSKDEGKSWSKTSQITEPVNNIIIHPYAKNLRAFALTEGTSHYYTKDAGASWTMFKTDLVLDIDGGLSFHNTELDWIVYRGLQLGKNDGFFDAYAIHAFYTKDSFKSSKPLLKYVTDCFWANSVKLSGKNVASKDKIFCLQWDESQQKDDIIYRDPEYLKLFSSDSYFSKGVDVVKLDGAPIAIGTTQSFLVSIASSQSKPGRVDLYSSGDGVALAKAYFPPDASIASFDSYTLLDSSEHRIFVDIKPILSSTGLSAPYGNLYISDSSGTFFTKSLAHTNHDDSGRVDFERIESEAISGTLLANVVENWKDVEADSRINKKITSRISFDDGARWNFIQPPRVDANGNKWPCDVSVGPNAKCALHFHSRTEMHNLGRTFSTLSAPGFIVGVGNVGEALEDYSKGDTFVSSDGGLSWTNAVRGPCKYEILDTGSLIVLVPDTANSNSVIYSTKRGVHGSWTTVPISPPDLEKWTAVATSMDPDSTSSNMMIITANDASTASVIHLDFSKVQSRKCDFDSSNPGKSKDFELWTPKLTGSGGDVCILGEELGYYRRKQDADCYVGRKFKHPEIKRTTCECGEVDFECDFGFRREDGGTSCVRYGNALDQPADCPVGKQYDGSSGYRKIPGDKCTGGKALDAKVKVDCKKQTGVAKPPGKDPVSYPKVFNERIERLVYFRQSSVVLLLQSGGNGLLRSDNEGVSWTEVDFFKDKYPLLLIGLHDADPKRAYFVTTKSVFYTKDALSTKPMLIDAPSQYNELGVQILDYHPTEPDYLVFVGYPGKCPDVSGCFTQVYLTFDSGKSWLNNNKPVETWATKCVWAWDKAFGEGGRTLGKDAVFCSSYKDKNGKIGQDMLGNVGFGDNPLQLVLISNGGKDRKVLLDHGVANFYVVDTVLVVLMDNGVSYNLKVSVDGVTFVDTQFPPNMDLAEEGFTVLESDTNGIFLDLAQNLQSHAEYGHLFKSNSNGTQYSRILQYSNRNRKGYVDFEKMKGVPGILIANVVQNPLDVSAGKKHIGTKISFDDGSTWKELAAPKVDAFGNDIDCGSNCFLNIYCKISGSSESDRLSGGKSSIHSSAHAAGVVVAVGSVGERLEDYVDSNMYLTKDAGRTWTEIRKDAHKWAIGDHGAMIVMTNDEAETNTLVYSWDYGDSWAEFKFSETPIRVSSVQSEPSGTSLKFIVTGSSIRETFVFGIDFGAVLPRMCGKPSKSGGDFVEWTPAGENGKDRCFLGQDLSFWRRKSDVDCYIGKEFENLPDEVEQCECSEGDYECDFSFYRNSENLCVPYTVDPLQPINCKPGEKFKGSSGYRKIPSSKCKGGKDLTGKIDRICGETDGKSGSVKITTNLLKYDVLSYFYFNQTSTIMMRDESGRVYVSNNSGQSWGKPPELKDSYSSMMLDPFRANKRAYFLRDNSLTVTWTDDVGKSFKEIKVPTKPNRFGVTPLMLHSTESSYLIWLGDKDCDQIVSPNCHSVAFISTNEGKSWKEIAKYVQKCAFAKESSFSKPSKDIVLCQAFNVNSGDQRKMGQSTARHLIRSTNLGGRWESVLESTVNFATSGLYMVAAQLEANASQMKMFTSTDSATWTRATFEDDEKIPDYGYTLLDSSSSSAFVEVFTSKGFGAEFGTLYRSVDDSATKFKISLLNVNQDSYGYTDFEKLLGIEGLAIANSVVNAAAVISGSSKEVRTHMTFNDGNLWKPLNPPKVDSKGRSYDCKSECYLNLHHFTERVEQSDMFSSASAIGFMMGVGNVGPHLIARNDGGTFLTRDAGLTWIEVQNDAYQFEFGDNGGIILIANDETETDEILYSLNYGKTFESAKLSEQLGGGKLRVKNIITEPYGAYSSFVVFGMIRGGTHDLEIAAIHLNFQNVWPRICQFDKNNEANSDFEAWSPTGEKSGDESCILGEQIQYYRRKADRECHSKGFFEAPVTLSKTCKCTEHDFTCDIGFSRDSSNNCVANFGYVPPTPTCNNGKLKYPTGYIKIKGNKCEGGLALDVGKVEGCASVISLVGWMGIFAVVLGIPAIVSYTVIHLKRGGRIRLPIDDESSNETAFTGDWTARASQFMRSGLILFMGATEIGLSKIGSLYDWVRENYNRQTAGYTALQTNYYDVDLEPDSSLLFEDD